MKKLYQFTLKQKATEKVTEKKKDKDGKDIEVTKDVEKEVDRHVILRKPTRSLFDEAELYYGVILSEGIKAGLLTRALLSKRFSNDGGVMSDRDKEDYADLYLKLFENQNELERISLIESGTRTEEEKKRLTSLMKDNGTLKREIQDFELAQASLFEQTAENRARNKTILWWVLNLAYHNDPDTDKTTPVFDGNSFDEKLNSYDTLEESEDPFHDELLRKLVYYISYWYVGNAQTEEEFAALLKDLEESGLEEESMEAIDEASKDHDKQKASEASVEPQKASEVKPEPQKASGEAKPEPKKAPYPKPEEKAPAEEGQKA